MGRDGWTYTRRRGSGNRPATPVAGIIAIALTWIAASPASGFSVSITHGPEPSTESRVASFAFTADQRSTFHCALDGERPRACSSPVTYGSREAPLTLGGHRFEVIATSPSGRGGSSITASDHHRWEIVDPPTRPDDGGGSGGRGEPEPSETQPERLEDPGTDLDDDGFPAGRDLCPFSPSGMAATVRGCSPLELPVAIRDPIDDVSTSIGRALTAAGQRGKVAKGWSGPLRKGTRLLERAEAEVSAGDPCGGVGPAKDAKRQASSAVRRYDARTAKLTRGRPGAAAKNRRADAKRALAATLRGGPRRLMAEAAAQTRRLANDLRRSCRGLVKSVRKVETVVAVDDAAGKITLADGSVFAAPADGHFYEGGVVHLRGKGKPAGGVMTKAKVKPGKAGGKKIVISKASSDLDCLTMRIAPVQRFSPPWGIDPSAIVLHPPGGYRRGGVLELQSGMRLGSAPVNPLCPANAPDGGEFRYSMRITLQPEALNAKVAAVNTLGDVAPKLAKYTIAHSLTPGDHPVPLPPEAFFAGKAPRTIKVQSLRQLCHFNIASQAKKCSAPVAAGKPRKFKLEVRDEFVAAIYEENRFALDTVQLDKARLGRVVDLMTKAPKVIGDAEADSLSFSAEAFLPEIEGESWSGATSYPATGFVGIGEPFAVFRDERDFHEPGKFFATELSGVKHESGLSWPLAHGTHNGSPFSYRTETPRLEKDVVSVCTAAIKHPTNTQFVSGVGTRGRLPLSPVESGHSLQPLEIPGYGLEYTTPLQFTFVQDADDDGLFEVGARVVAARPGHVVARSALQMGNSWPGQVRYDGGSFKGPKPAGYSGIGNFVLIEHWDGSFGYYGHLKKYSVKVKVGERIRRGQRIGRIGLTGHTSVPVLDWINLRFNKKGQLEPSAIYYQDAAHEGCWQPRPGDRLDSNNYLTPPP